MKEVLEFRINYEFAHLLFKANEGKDLGQITKSVKVVELSRDDPRYNQVPIVAEEVKRKYGKGFFFGWQIKRKYSKHEIDTAILFHLKIKTVFEPTGEDCGTIYDKSTVCEICGVGRSQIGVLKLEKGTIPKKDITKTIGGEVIVSEKFKQSCLRNRIRGIQFKSVEFKNNVESRYYQLLADKDVDLSDKTQVGDDPFNCRRESEEHVYEVGGREVIYEKEVYVCPKGHLLGLNLISEPYVLKSSLTNISDNDFFVSRQKIGVKRGLLYPESLYLCSPTFRRMVLEDKLTGFDFEIAHVEG